MRASRPKPQSRLAGFAARLPLLMGFSWTFVGNVTYAASQWLIVIAIARIGTPEVLGQFALALAITAPVFMGTNLQLRGVQATDAAHLYPFRSYLKLRVWTTIIALVVVGGVVSLVKPGLTGALTILLVGVAKAVESFSDVIYGFLQRQERLDLIGQSMLLRGPLSLAAMTIALASAGSLHAAIVAQAVVWSSVLVGFDARNARVAAQTVSSLSPAEGRRLERVVVDEAKSTQPRSLLRLASVGLPLGLGMLLLSLNTAVPRYFVDAVMGSYHLGIYAAVAAVPIIGATMVTALGQTLLPRMASEYAAGKVQPFAKRFYTLAASGLGIGLVGSLLAALWGDQLLILMFGAEFSGQGGLLFLFMVYATVQYVASAAGYAMTAARLFVVQLPIFFLVAGVTLVGACYLVPRFGLVGAVQALIIAAVIQLLASLIVVRRAVAYTKHGVRERRWTSATSSE